MSEVEALLAFYGAIDRAVVAEKVKPESLAPLLGAYSGGAATGWYDGQYRPWVAGVKKRAALRARAEMRSEVRAEAEAEAEAAAEAEPPLEDTDAPSDAAAEALPADDERRPASPHVEEVAAALAAFDVKGRSFDSRLGARRLLAVAVAARAFPEHFGVGGTHAELANAPLVFDHPGLDHDVSARATQLHTHVASQFREMNDWSELVKSSVRLKLLPDTFVKQADATPCSGRLIMRPDPGGSDSDPCTVLEAGFITDKVSFEQAKNYLEPSNWVYPDSFWCRMEKVEPPVATNSWVYHETVATSCPASSAFWTVSTDLQFWFSHPAENEARVEYDFPGGVPAPLSDIEIDEGSLRIVKIPEGIQVTTTKRVRFAGSFDGAGLAMFMCATGYTSKLEDMIFSVATATAGNTQPFPVPPPKGGPTQGGPVTTQPDDKNAASTATAKNTAAKNTGTNGESLEDVAKEAADFVAAYLKDCADICTSSLESVQKGTYKVENVWEDGLKMWSSYVTGLGKALDLGTRAAKAATKSSTNET